MRSPNSSKATVGAALIAFAAAVPAASSDTTLPTSATATLCAKDDGYRGIWYSNQPSGDEYKFKYSGGFATYPQQLIPIAIYSPQANKTFFCYGGTSKTTHTLLHMVSYYDHSTGMVPRPTILLDKKTTDAHENPTLSIDDAGYLWIFSNSHGQPNRSSVRRSRKPHSIDAFDLVTTPSFAYSQPWHVPGRGFLFLHTLYQGGRRLVWRTSPDGFEWSAPHPLAFIDMGHYQISCPLNEKIGTAFNHHPRPGGLNARTNLYYLETRDFGATWTDAAGTRVATPVTTSSVTALVHDYLSEGLLVYLKDLQYDARSNPVILFLTSKGYESGPKNDPRTWRTAQWTGTQWRIRPVTISDNNYDFGSLYIEPEGTWRIIAPTEPGPQRYNPGGEVALWTSSDEGVAWKKVRQLTRDSARNHTYVRRPVNAHPDFYALWADGNAREPSESSLYFTDREGMAVRRLPTVMTGDFAKPEVVAP